MGDMGRAPNSPSHSWKHLLVDGMFCVKGLCPRISDGGIFPFPQGSSQLSLTPLETDPQGMG